MKRQRDTIERAREREALIRELAGAVVALVGAESVGPIPERAVRTVVEAPRYTDRLAGVGYPATMRPRTRAILMRAVEVEAWWQRERGRPVAADAANA